MVSAIVILDNDVENSFKEINFKLIYVFCSKIDGFSTTQTANEI